VLIPIFVDNGIYTVDILANVHTIPVDLLLLLAHDEAELAEVAVVGENAVHKIVDCLTDDFGFSGFLDRKSTRLNSSH